MNHDTEPISQPARKRRKFSFSLRTLMVFMLVVSVLLGLVGMRVQRAREQHAVLTKLEASGWLYFFTDGISHFGKPGLWELAINSNYIDRIVFVRGDVFAYEHDLASVAELKNLQILDASNTKISNLIPLAELRNLQKLDVSRTQASDLSSVAKLTILQYLNISNTQVSNLTPLANLINIQVTDLTPMKKMKNLQYLYVSNTQISDLTPLAKLRNLILLDVSNTQVSDQQIQQLQKALPDCEIYH